MRKTIIVTILALFSLSNSFSPSKIGNETETQKQERMQWWTNDRLGMFIHWGLYALPARHEWVQKYERIPNEEYNKYFEVCTAFARCIRNSNNCSLWTSHAGKPLY